jgi:hypothetical protein
MKYAFDLVYNRLFFFFEHERKSGACRPCDEVHIDGKQSV